MEKNIFKLDNEQLKGIAHAFREKVEEGLNKNNAEIQCIPTFILPKATDVKGKALVLDLGGSLSNLFIKYHNLSNIRLLNSYI